MDIYETAFSLKGLKVDAQGITFEIENEEDIILNKDEIYYISDPVIIKKVKKNE